MKNALKLIILILLISFVVDKLAYYSLNKISDKVLSGQAIGKLNHYLLQKDSLDLIVFGTSRANHHIDVEQFTPSSFNMGVDGSAIAYSATLIQLLPKNKKQVVVWHVDPKKVFDINYDGEDINGLVSKYHRDATIKFEINKIDQNNPLQTFYWSIDYNGKAFGILKNLVRPNYNYKEYNGYDPLTVSETQREIFKSTLLKQDEIKCSTNYEATLLVKNYLNAVKLFCEQNNKTLVMLTSPTYDPTCPAQYKELKKLMTEMKINYYDYSAYFVKDNSFDYWKDKTHLSKLGAEIYSKELKSLFNEKMIIN